MPPPAYAWITSEQVKDALGRALVEGTQEDLDRARKAAAAHVESARSDLVWLDSVAEDIPADVWLGTVLLVNRLMARRGSPQGVATFGDFGPATVLRHDPDIEKMLGVGRYAKPGRGMA